MRKSSMLVAGVLMGSVLAGPRAFAGPRARAVRSTAGSTQLRPKAARPTARPASADSAKPEVEVGGQIAPVAQPHDPTLRKIDRKILKAGKAGLPPLTVPTWDVRLLGRLHAHDTQDEKTDEIYFKLVATTAASGAIGHHRVTKKEWAMGPYANRSVLHNLFEGTVGPLKEVSFVLVLAEKDNGGSDWELGNTIPMEKATAQWAADQLAPNVPSGKKTAVRDKMADDVRQSVHEVLWDFDDMLGLVGIAFDAGRLRVHAVPGSAARVEHNDDDSATVAFTGLGSHYTLDLTVAAPTQGSPTQYNWLSTEKENCSKSTVRVASENGDVIVKKGEEKPVDVWYHHIVWHCGTSKESTDGPPNTHFAIVRRKPTGDRMYLFTYSTFPAYAWLKP